ncbi:MAG: hypothetical protein FWG80_04860 [Alphaproteobacteria bacterium]|nr:hypothetical protein [Alphaproteobacteria bacterium]
MATTRASALSPELEKIRQQLRGTPQGQLSQDEQDLLAELEELAKPQPVPTTTKGKLEQAAERIEKTRKLLGRIVKNVTLIGLLPAALIYGGIKYKNRNNSGNINAIPPSSVTINPDGNSNKNLDKTFNVLDSLSTANSDEYKKLLEKLTPEEINQYARYVSGKGY